jgi:hypothetical protein
VGVEHLMNTRPVTVAVIGVVASLLLGGCGADDASPGTAPPGAAPSESAAPPESAAASPSASARAKDRKDSGGKEGAAGRGRTTDRTDDETDVPSDTTEEPAPAPGASPSPGSAPALEMPEAPEATVSSLSELLPPSNPAPLVTTPLPRAASAQGRLLGGFPDALRPTRATRVQSSSVSPSGDGLQVGLVATTSLSPDQVLLAYRIRLARRGMVETETPPSVAGSSAAAFRRGDSVVTVTVTPRGSGTSYSVHASLRAERG